MLIDIGNFFGRFHPLIVHLPIGFLLLAVFFTLVSIGKKYQALRIAIAPSLLVGTISATFACITGYVLSLSGDYDIDTLDSHLWAGICTMIISFVAWLISIKKIPLVFLRSRKALMATILILLIVVNVTGHLGGSLTHGSGYLSTSMLFDKPNDKRKITNIKEAFIFADLVHPILEDKCSGCHNSSKKKGKLSVESYQAITKGGKHGAVLKPGDPANSEIIKRVSLNPKHKKFMPGDGKTPLSPEEIAIIKWWIERSAGSSDKKIADINMPEDITKYAVAYFNLETKEGEENYAVTNIHTQPVPKAVLEKLTNLGFVIKYLNFKPALLDVTLASTAGNENIADKLKTLLLVKDNIIWLNVSGTNVSDNEMQTINQFKNLERLKLYKNPVTDNGITKLQGLSNVKILNLNNTKITKNCLPVLAKISSLKTAYVWGTEITQKDIVPGGSALKIIVGN